MGKAPNPIVERVVEKVKSNNGKFETSRFIGVPLEGKLQNTPKVLPKLELQEEGVAVFRKPRGNTVSKLKEMHLLEVMEKLAEAGIALDNFRVIQRGNNFLVIPDGKIRVVGKEKAKEEVDNFLLQLREREEQIY